VYRTKDTPGGGVLLSTANAGGNIGIWIDWHLLVADRSVFTVWNGGAIYRQIRCTHTGGQKRRMVARLDSALATPLDAKLSGVAGETNGAGTVPSGDPNHTLIIGDALSTGSVPIGAHVGEGVVFFSRLSDNDAAHLDAYLQRKYG
jgi:hypothetical protein